MAPGSRGPPGRPDRTFTVDEAGAIIKLAIATTPTAGADDGTYLVVWNGHGDAVELAEVDATTGVLTSANRFIYSTWGTPTPTVTTLNGCADLGFRYRYLGRYDVAWGQHGRRPGGPALHA